MRGQDDFTTLYQRFRVEEQLLWYQARARLLAARHRRLLAVMYGLLILTGLGYMLAAVRLVSTDLWPVFGTLLPVTSLALVATLGYSSLGRRTSLYLDVARALEAARAEGEALRLSGTAGEAEIARWVERVERILQAGEGAAGQVGDLSPDWEVRRTAIGDE